MQVAGPPCPTISTLALWLPIIVNVALAAIVIWYTLETRWLRKQNHEQLDLLKQQGIKSLAPFILPSIVNFSTKLREYIRDSPLIDKDWFEKELRNTQFKQGVKYLGS